MSTSPASDIAKAGATVQGWISRLVKKPDITASPGEDQASNDQVAKQSINILGDAYSSGPWRSLDDFIQRKEVAKGRGCIIVSAIATNVYQRVAIKAYERSQINEGTIVHIRREASLIKGLRHEAICQLYGSFEDTKYVYIVMELCSQGDLMEFLNGPRGVRRLTEERAVQTVLLPLLQALQLLHGKGIVHRDIKPENLFMSKGIAKLGDFGLAINQRLEPPMSQLGTLDYMAPEVFRRPGENSGRRQALYDEKVDIWACGVLAYEVVTGEPPFNAGKNGSLTKDLIQRAAVPIAGVWPHRVSPELADFIKQTLQKDPRHRPSAEDLLSHPWILSHLPTSTEAVSPPISISANTSTKHPVYHPSHVPAIPENSMLAKSCPDSVYYSKAPQKQAPAVGIATGVQAGCVAGSVSNKSKALPSVVEEGDGCQECDDSTIRDGLTAVPEHQPLHSLPKLEKDGSFERMLHASGIKAKTGHGTMKVTADTTTPSSPQSPSTPSPTYTPKGVTDKWQSLEHGSIKKSLFSSEMMEHAKPYQVGTGPLSGGDMKAEWCSPLPPSLR
ncbi:unnamed protein product [Closterium sp. Yama58-4]|nr:unnamed protein product [Closterium sp. Yama58-4]